MQAKIQKAEHSLGDKQQDMTKNAKDKIYAVKHDNKVMEQGMNKKVQEYEKDRIGQGSFIGQNFGIGGMNAEEKAREFLKGREKSLQIPPTKSLKPKGEK